MKRRFHRFAVVVIGVLAFTTLAHADLNSAELGGGIRVRGQYLDPVAFDDRRHADDFIEQRTRLNLNAVLTEGVNAFLEFQSYDIYGDDFVGLRPVRLTVPEDDSGDVELYQGWLEAEKLFDYPLTVRVGRQELAYGREWLLGNRDANSLFSGLSFDTVKLRYTRGDIQIDAWASKLVERRAQETDADTDFYGLYGTYGTLEELSLDTYWLFVRNAEDDTEPRADTDRLHTVGGRLFGIYRAFDYSLEGAYQFGDAAWFRRRADYDAWAIDSVLGYTFDDTEWEPRLGVGMAFFSGDDDWYDDDARAFNRLFSDVEYGEILDRRADLSNLFVFHAMARAKPIEKLKLDLKWHYYLADQDEIYLRSGSFMKRLFGSGRRELQGAAEIGHEIDVSATYDYSNGLSLRAGWAHFFADDALEDGVPLSYNGLKRRGTDDADADYFFLEGRLEF